jgi:hypothetical protein
VAVAALVTSLCSACTQSQIQNDVCLQSVVQLADAFVSDRESPNRPAAIELLKELSARSYAPAQYLLARVYLYDASADQTDGVALLKSAASSKYPSAMAMLGLFYLGQLYLPGPQFDGKAVLEGKAVGRDVGQGTSLIRQAAEAGDRSAEGTLGSLLSKGARDYRDAPDALMWDRRSITNVNTPIHQRVWDIDFGCPAVQQAMKRLPDPPRVFGFDDDELAVYAAALSDSSRLAGKTAFVTNRTERGDNDTQLKAWEPEWRRRGILEFRPVLPNQSGLEYTMKEDKTAPAWKLPVSMLDEYRAKNALQYRMTRPIPTQFVSVVLTEADNLAQANTKGFGEGLRGIARFSRDQIVGDVTFSRVAFDPTHHLALLGEMHKCEPALCGDGDLALFEKKHGRWMRVRQLSFVFY